MSEQFLVEPAVVTGGSGGPGVDEKIRFEIDFEFGRLYSAGSETDWDVKWNERVGVHPEIGWKVKYEAEKEKEESGADRTAKGHVRLDSASGRNVPPTAVGEAADFAWLGWRDGVALCCEHSAHRYATSCFGLGFESVAGVPAKFVHDGC